MDINEPVVNPGLVAAMNCFQAEPTPEHESLFLAELKKARFLAPVNITLAPKPGGETGGTVLEEGATIKFHMLTNSKGGSFFPAFSDWGELRKWSDAPDRQTLVVTFDDLSAMALKDDGENGGLVINPYGQNIVPGKEHIAVLNGRPAARPYTVQKETKVNAWRAQRAASRAAGSGETAP